MRLWIAAAAFALVPTAASACSFDTDCNVGSTCMKRSGQLYGVCVGGLSPGEKRQSYPSTEYQQEMRRRQQERQRDALDYNRTQGKQCSWDTQCGVGSVCLKGSSAIYGVCIRQ